MAEGQPRWQPSIPTKSRRYCSVPGCGNRTGPMFTFPRDPPMRQLWVIQCKIQRAVSSTMVVCRLHFADTDVVLSVKGTMKPRFSSYPTLRLPGQVLRRARRNCSVATCAKGCDDDGVLLHLFPRTKIVARQWLEACKLPAYNKSSRVCSRHFADTDYTFSGTGCDRALRPGAVPSVDLPGEAVSQEVAKSRQWTIMKPQGVEVKTEVIVDPGEDSDGSRGADLEDVPPDTDEDMSDDEAAREDAMDVVVPPVVAAVEVQVTPALDIIESEKDMVLQLMESFMKQNLTASVKTMKLSEIVPLDPLSSFDIADNGDKPLSILDLIKTETQMQALTGVSSSVLDCLAQLLTLIVPACLDTELSMKQRVVMTLTKLRTNMGFEVLSTFFGVDRQSCGKYFASTIKLMALILRPCIYWPTHEENVMSMPQYFTRHFDTVMLLDIVEVPLESSTNCLKCHSGLHAPDNGKSHIKFFAGVAPSGLIIYLSKVHSGKAANKKILEESDLIAKQLLKPGIDAVMVDKELRLDSVWAKNDIKVYHSPNGRWGDLVNAKKQVDKAVQKMKMFSILSGKLCNATAPHIDDILTVVAGLINLTSSLISSERIIAVKECAC